MAGDLAYHPDGCTCPTHASIRRFLFDFTPSPPLGIPADRVNAWCKRHLSESADIGPSGTPQLGHEHDTTGAGSMYRLEGMWRWDGISARQNRKP